MPPSITIDVPTSIYPLEAVQAAAYVFTGRAYVRIEDSGERTVRVRLTVKGSSGRDDAEKLDGEFRNELLHHTLRHRVSAANQKIREYVVTRALLSSQPAEERRNAVDAQAGPQAETAPDPKADEALLKEIQKLLAEVDQNPEKEDPLDISVPWEEKRAAEKNTERPATPPEGRP